MTDTKPTLPEQIETLQRIIGRTTGIQAFVNPDILTDILASLKELQNIKSQPVPVEPVATVYDAYDTTGIDWHCRHPPAVGAKIYDQTAIDSLLSQLQVAQQEYSDCQAAHTRADKAEAALRLELARLDGEIPYGN